MDRLTAMRVFAKTVEHGTVSAAADSMGMSRAMTSRYLESLEDWLGVRLLHRTTRRLGLTDAGAQALARCKEMLDLEEDVQAQASQAGTLVQGKLRLTTAPSFAQAQLTAAVVDFQSRHPAVEIDLLVVDRAVNLAEERIDLAVRISNRIDPGLVARRIAMCRSVLCAAPGYLQQHGSPAAPQALRSHRCIIHSTGFAPEYTLRRGDDETTVQASASLTANETSVMRAAALAGAGIAMLPTYYVGDDLAQGRLVQILPDYELQVLNIQAVYLSRQHQPKPLRLLIEFLAERFGGDVAPWDAQIANARKAVQGK
jgi:DNA-binding transcriptional LysR family regulator